MMKLIVIEDGILKTVFLHESEVVEELRFRGLWPCANGLYANGPNGKIVASLKKI